MSIRNLDKIIRPRSVAVIGASDVPGKVGFTVLANLIGHGFQGPIYPINPKREQIQGLKTFADVASLPETVDLAIVCTPAPTVPGLVRACGRAGVLGMVVLSAGFREIGTAGRRLENQVMQAAVETPGLRILGPNCLGLIIPGMNLSASFAVGMPKQGRIAFLSQSGALCTSVLDWALERQIGFSCFVSVGNMADVTISDLIDYLADDDQTRSMILYIESLEKARPFMSAARAFAHRKPIVVYKAGRFADSARAAASHTGALAGVDSVYQAAFERAGMERVLTIDDVFDCAQVLACHTLPKGPRLAIVTNAGGPGVMASDSLLARNGQLAQLAPETIQTLDTVLPSCWSHANPVDVLGDAGPERFVSALNVVIEDRAVDAVLVVLTPQAMSDATGTAEAVAKIVEGSPKPILAAWMGGATVRPGAELLTHAGVPTYTTPDHAIRAFMHLVSYARNLEVLYETPRLVVNSSNAARALVPELFERAAQAGETTLSQVDSKSVLEAYDIPTTSARVAPDVEAAVRTAEGLGYPVVLKILSPQITHKTEIDGVALNLTSPVEVRAAFERVTANAARLRPDARIDGVTVEPMIIATHGIEMIVGAKRDPVFGPVILVGAGGVAAEVFQDRAVGLPPLNERLARHMLESLRSWPLLAGYRGRKAADVERLIQMLMRFSNLIADRPEIVELDMNPVLVTPEQVLALDARIIIDRAPDKAARPFAHLAIRPYPEEFVRQAELAGQSFVFRPIRAEDEPHWHRFLVGCSPETLEARFRCQFKPNHEIATRYCFPDYDREMAIVAELRGPEPTIVGVARLMADPDHDEAEFAVIVNDAWQHKGLGSKLTDVCLEIAAAWGVRRLTADTEPTNNRMLAIFRRHGFQLSHVDDVIKAQKELGPTDSPDDRQQAPAYSGA